MEVLKNAGEDSKCDIVHQLLCMACLGSGQTLRVLKDEALNLYNMTVNCRQQLIHNVSPRVCWQCEILLQKVINFRERMTECYNILSSSHMMWGEVTRPSRLQMFTTAQIDIPPVDRECSVSDVKQEIEEVELHGPSEAKETQPCMGCLCEGRRLNTIRDKELKSYTDILTQKMQVVCDVSAVSPRLCWECCCMLRQAARFSAQSVESYQTLMPSLLTADVQDITSLLCSGVSLPPRLRRSVRDRVDIPPQAHIHNSPPPVKLEPGSLGFGVSSTPPVAHVQRPDEPAAEVKQTSRRDAAHVTTSNITCDRCHREFTSKQQLIRHIAGNIYPQNTNVCDDNSYVCVESALKDPRRRRQSAQVTSHAADKPYQCNECSRMFRYKSQIIHHIRKHTGEKPYQCSQCLTGFCLKQHLVQHLRIHLGTKPYECSQCAKAYSRKHTLVVHMKTHTGEKPYQCKQCSKKYSRKQLLDDHMTTTHTGEKPYQCSQCSTVFSLKQYLAQHMRSHVGAKPYKCSQCSKAFSRRQTLVDHMTTHTGEKPYQCNQCSKTYNRNHLLVDHMRTHSKEKLFQCSQCSKAFARKLSLAQHLRTHSEDRPHQCSQCPKAYIQKHHLIEHMRIHTKEKPFQCSQCPKIFTRKHVYVRHLRTHSGERPYRCSQCSKTYIRKEHLVDHMITHTRERAFSVQSECKNNV